MNKKRYKVLTMIGSVAVAGAYSYINGKGVFNKPRFKEQHNAISRYVESHYPGSTYSPITPTHKGWTTVITQGFNKKVLLYVYKANDGIYIFNETEAIKS